MSISGAVAELNKEIERLIDSRLSRTGRFRDRNPSNRSGCAGEHCQETCRQEARSKEDISCKEVCPCEGNSSCGQAGDVCRHAEEDVGFRQGPGRRKGDRREVTRSQAGAELPPD